MESETAEKLSPEVRRAANAVARKWPEVVEAEDVEQEIWLRILETPGSVEKMTDIDSDARVDWFERMGHQIASREIADYEVFSGQVYYGTEEVREILDRGALTNERVRTDEERIDLELGLEALGEVNELYVQVIRERYVEGSYSLHSSTNRDRLMKAVDSLTRHMNNVHKNRRHEFSEGPGTRPVLSNGSARAITANQYSGDDGGEW